MSIMDLCEICGNPEYHTTHDGVKHRYIAGNNAKVKARKNSVTKDQTSLGMCSRCVQSRIGERGK